MNKQQLFETIYDVVTVNDHQWQYVGDGWLDIQTGLIWLEEEKKPYTYDEAMSLFCSKDKRLPSKEEYEKAEKHGIRSVIKFDGHHWTSSVHPYVSNLACGFYGNNGFIGYFVGRYLNGSVRCVRGP